MFSAQAEFKLDSENDPNGGGEIKAAILLADFILNYWSLKNS